MRAIPVLATVFSSLLVTGCGDLLTLHPLYTDNERVIQPGLEGRWENDDDVMTVTREDSVYTVTQRPKSTPSEEQRFEMHLVDVGGVRFADIVPADGTLGHMLLRVRLTGSELRVAFFDSEWLRRRVPHEDVRVSKNNRQAVLIERTPELRKIVEKYAQSPEAYDDELVYRRAAGAAGTPSAEVNAGPGDRGGETAYSIEQEGCRIR